MADTDVEVTKKARIEQELEHVRNENGGLLHAHDVVEFARSNPESALHTKFDWDDTEAAEKWRLVQARQVIRVYVRVLDVKHDPVRAWVSLGSDRQRPKGGYRSVEDVLRDPQRRAEFVQQAMREARSWMARYKLLDELAGVFAAIESVEEQKAS